MQTNAETQSSISAKKAETIRDMFNQISRNYDRANTVLSMGIHHLWRKKLVRYSGAKAGDKVLDCATGTGDLAFEFERVVGESGEVLGTDFSEGMLKYGVEKALARASRVRFETADVMKLPYETARFDLASISFGIRNVADPVQGMRELARVVRPGGRVLILEFGQPGWKPFRSVYNFYSDRVLPRVGGWISGQPGAYRYLQNSSAQFPCAGKFLELADSTGQFSKLEYVPVSGGIAYIYKLTRK